MTIDELEKYFERLPDQIFDNVPDIVAETATEYFKERFTEKSFDKSPWAPAKIQKHTGSLLVESGNLLNSIKPSEITREHVVISAGNEKVEYAKVHNEGYTGPVIVPAHSRHTKYGDVDVRQHTRMQNIPQRQFMGYASELMEKIKERIDALLNEIL
ncbi:MAG: phage virion morphogenesis protein [Bacteroidota bacterium]